MLVDLRSDVLTKATPEMKEAMMSASMGDDVFRDDPTTELLQEKVARITGKDAALFVVSGTMANQLAIASLTYPHDEVILDVKSHIFQFEQGAPAVISGVQLRPAPFIESLPDEEMLENAIRFPDVHHPVSRLLCLEVTHNYNGGMIPDLERLKDVCLKARDLGLKIHIDGARVWNAVVASGIPVTEYASLCDSMMFCFSKGLGTPIGSILVGNEDVINRAHYLRKGIGGGWRQPGMLAAAAIYALDHNIDRLAEDHCRAQMLAEAVDKHPDLEIVGRVDTNMVFLRPKKGDLETYSNRLTERGILHDWQHFKAIRLVTYLGIDDEMIEYCIEQVQTIPPF
ncbi:MAG TPA: low specificity L-threonine aldolase [Desulfobacteraceae bacterium]|nr:low specificity L-threonine aldolase [Desulfobacteraceae bacterium]HPJ68782.1 low specificity L-threonine aldolase [Desulfobacteraceae bacterium]HPQ28878.1 low specificity L-threonine aldolase [Desulfobacteraceae bacterium]